MTKILPVTSVHEAQGPAERPGPPAEAVTARGLGRPRNQKDFER